MNVQPLPLLLRSDRRVFRCSASHRPDRVGRMHGIAEQRHFISVQMVQQAHVLRDEGRPASRDQAWSTLLSAWMHRLLPG